MSEVKNVNSDTPPVSGWKNFWEFLNIRKFLAIIISTLFLIVVLIGVFVDINSEYMEILGIVKDVLLIIVAFYFGYSSGSTNKQSV